MSDLAFLQELVNRVADGAYIVNEAQRLIAWNAAAEQLLGFRAADVIGMPCYQILGGRSDGDCVICRQGCFPFTAGRRGQLVPSFDARVRTAGGHPRWVNISIIAVTVETGREDLPTVVVHMFRDIESRKQAEAFTKEVATWARQLKLPSTDIALIADEMPLTTPLSPREFQVLELLTQGASTETIASTLIIGIPTARNHIQRVLHKLGVHSRLEAVTYAREHHLLD
jgi:DNA-binding CsgD family transcriptional regulator